MSKRSRRAIESSDEDYEPVKKRNIAKYDDYESSLSDSFSSLSIDDTNNGEVDYHAILEEENEGKNAHLSTELNRITAKIQQSQVTLTSILACKLHDYDKETAVELFGILNTCDRNSLEYIQLNKLLCHMVTSDEIIENDMPTINKILRACISKEDKLKAIELYNMFYNVSVSNGDLYSEEWYLLKKKINSIISKKRSKEELALLEEKEKEVKNYQQQKMDMKTIILNLDADISVKKKLYDMYCSMVSSLDDSTKHSLHDKLLWYTKLPHNKQIIVKYDNISSYCTDIYNTLNASLYGMYEVKEKILIHINNRLKNTQYPSILALLGAPGCGKSAIVKCIAKAVGLPYNKLSFGGAIDSTLILGGDAMWKNSSPGMLMKLLCNSKCANPIILLDEIDKLTDSAKGKEVQSALLHVLDKTQNDHFNDNFLSEYPHDLSNVWFIATMNSDSSLDPALKDRLEIIHVPSYKKDELVNIMLMYVLPEACIEHGYKKEDITMSDNACYAILNNIKNDIKASGVRKVQEEVKNIVSKISFLDKVGYKEEFNLSFKLKQPISFPFLIDESTVKSLMKKKTSDNNHLSMFA